MFLGTNGEHSAVSHLLIPRVERVAIVTGISNERAPCDDEDTPRKTDQPSRNKLEE